MTVEITENNDILIDGNVTGLRVRQKPEATVVYSIGPGGLDYTEYPMPHHRYSTAYNEPVAGVPGREQFEKDVRGLLTKI